MTQFRAIAVAAVFATTAVACSGDAEPEPGTDADPVDYSQADYSQVTGPLGTSPDWYASGTQPGALFGQQVAIGDVNDNGYPDILVGEPDFSGSESRQGRVSLFIGSSSGYGSIADLTIAGDEEDETFGTAVAMGDFSDNGCDELAVGAPGYDDTGRVLLYSVHDCTGADDAVATQLLWSTTGATSDEQFGTALTTGDFTCNGDTDLAVSAPTRSATADKDGTDYTDNGAVQLFAGDPSLSDLLDATPDFSYHPDADATELGHRLETLAEYRGTDYTTSERCDAFAAGSPVYDDDRGTVQIFFHDDDGDIQTPIKLDGRDTGDEFGASLAALDSPQNTEINGHPLTALAVGAPGGGEDDDGYVEVVEYDEADGEPAVIWDEDGPHAGSEFGAALTGLDANASGDADLAVGAPGFDADDGDGAAFLYLGTPSDLSTSVETTIESDQSDTEFAAYLTALSDPDSDTDDLVVAAPNYDGIVGNTGKIFVHPGQKNCYIDGTFRAAGDTNPDNICESCDPAASMTGWSAADPDVVCDDGNPCTENHCDAGECSNPPADDGITCEDDGLGCTSHTCEDAECVKSVVDGCLIDGDCHDDGDAHPSASCFWCDSDEAAEQWVPRPAGDPCDNGLYCTEDDACDGAGQCLTGDTVDCDPVDCHSVVTCSNAAEACIAGQPETGTSCDIDDGVECTVGVCDDGECTAETADGYCRIDGECFDDGEQHPEDACRLCDADNPHQWSTGADGFVCAPAECVDDNTSAEPGACDDGDCVQGDEVECGRYVCDDINGECRTSCDDDTHCFGDAHCLGGECTLKPIADAGDDQTVPFEATVALDGTNSVVPADPDGDSTTFAWTQTGGEEVDLDDPNSPTPVFEAPGEDDVEDGHQLQFELVVDDGDKTSDPDDTTVTVTDDAPDPPVAVIDGPSSTLADETVTLDGSNSYDPGGTTIDQFNWAHLDGDPAPELDVADGGETVDIAFDAADIDEPTTYTFSLQVSTADANSEPAEHELLVSPDEEGLPTDPDGDREEPGLLGELGGSGCACNATGGEQLPAGALIAAALLGLVALRRRRSAVAVVAAAGVALFAVGCERTERPPPEADSLLTQVSLFNATHDVIPFDARTVHSDYAIDCDVVTGDPDRYLGDTHLSGAIDLASRIEYDPFSGLEVPIFADEQDGDIAGDCRLAVISTGTDDDRLEPIIITWPRDLPHKTIYPDVDAPAGVPPEDQTVVAEANYDDVDDEGYRAWRERPCGGNLEDCSEEEFDELLTPVDGADYSWRIVGDDPRKNSWDPEPLDERNSDDADSEDCHSGRDATPLRFDSPPGGTWQVESVDQTIETVDDEDDGDDADEWTCWDVTLLEDTDDDEPDDDAWQFCGSELLAKRIGSEHFNGDVFIDFFVEEQDESPPSVYEALTVNLERRVDGEIYETETMEAVRGHGVPSHIGLSWDAEAATACEPMVERPDECDQISLPAHLLMDVGDSTLRIKPGTIEALDPQADRRLEHIRGLYRVISDLRCSHERLGPDYMSHAGAYLEFVYFAGVNRQLE